MTRGRKPIGIDTATTQAEPTENGTFKKNVSLFRTNLAHPWPAWVPSCEIKE